MNNTCTNTSTGTLIKNILRTAPNKGVRRWDRLEQDQLERLIDVLEECRGVGSLRMYELRKRLYEDQVIEWSNQQMSCARTYQEDRYAEAPMMPEYPRQISQPWILSPTPRRSQAIPTAQVTVHTQRIDCPRCHTDAESSYIADGVDTLRCLSCGHRIHKSGPVVPQPSSTLELHEIEENESMIDEALVVQGEEELIEDADELTAAMDLETLEAGEDVLEDAELSDLDVPELTENAELLYAQRVFWTNSRVRTLRQYLVSVSLTHPLMADKSHRDAVWAVATIEGHGISMSPVEQKKLGKWILMQSYEDLTRLLPMGEDETVSQIPSMDKWIKDWCIACALRSKSFYSPTAAAKRLSPAFAVSKTTFFVAVEFGRSEWLRRRQALKTMVYSRR